MKNFIIAALLIALGVQVAGLFNKAPAASNDSTKGTQTTLTASTGNTSTGAENSTTNNAEALVNNRPTGNSEANQTQTPDTSGTDTSDSPAAANLVPGTKAWYLAQAKAQCAKSDRCVEEVIRNSWETTAQRIYELNL